MKLTTLVEKETDVKTINLYMKVVDDFTGSIKNTEGETVVDFQDTQVADFFPGDHYGEYLILNIDLETGKITNWKKPTEQQLKEFINSCREGV